MLTIQWSPLVLLTSDSSLDIILIITHRHKPAKLKKFSIFWWDIPRVYCSFGARFFYKKYLKSPHKLLFMHIYQCQKASPNPIVYLQPAVILKAVEPICMFSLQYFTFSVILRGPFSSHGTQSLGQQTPPKTTTACSWCQNDNTCTVNPRIKHRGAYLQKWMLYEDDIRITNFRYQLCQKRQKGNFSNQMQW